MYRHILVPIDHTDDSVDLVVRAVNLAASMKARVTFLHTERGLPPPAPTDFRDDRSDPRSMAQEVLAKAEAAARAWGVPSHAMAAGAADSASAMAEAARDRGCDLILVASHGLQRLDGLQADDGPIGVLRHSDLPVLVTATGSADAAVPAIRALREEHRLLAAALRAWSRALDAPDTVPDGWMASILAFVDRLESEHHPKERELFQRLRARTSTVDADLDEIGRQHEREGAMLARLAHQVQAALQQADAASRLCARRTLAGAVSDYTRFVWDHLGREEAVVLPAARRHLSESDWAVLDQAFGHADATDRRLACRRALAALLERLEIGSPRPAGGGNEGRDA